MASGSIKGAVASVSNENALVVVDYPFGKPPTRRTTVWTEILRHTNPARCWICCQTWSQSCGSSSLRIWSLTSHASFDDMGLRGEVLRGVYAYGLERALVVQQRVMQPCLQGRDVIATAKIRCWQIARFGDCCLAAARRREQAVPGNLPRTNPRSCADHTFVHRGPRRVPKD